MVCVQIHGTQTPPELPPLSRALRISFCFREEQQIKKITNKLTNINIAKSMTEAKRNDGCTHRQDPSDTDLPGCWSVCRFDRQQWSPWTQSRTSLRLSCPLWGRSGHWMSGWPWKEAWGNWRTCWGRSCLVVLHKRQHCCLLEAALSTQPCRWPWSRYRWPGY